MKMKILLLFTFTLIVLGLFSQNVNACGCGIAISDMKVFNALKETQAYLMIDVKDQTAYNEMPFFRFISMDEPHEVTIVFPIDQIPYDVEGKKISARKFLEDYGINKAESIAKRQDFSEFVNDVDKPIFLLSNGLLPSFFYTFSRSGIGSTGSAVKGVSPIAHFEFEGGTLDIYNVSSMQTLEEFVKTINITLTDKVKELVTKYNNYYVAVLYLKVPSVINENDINFLESCMPSGLESIKNELSEKTEFTYYDIQQMIERGISQSNCGSQGREILRNYVSSATYASEDVNGTLVIMKFKDNSNFFYPTSIVGSYKYPIKDQRYYVKVPDNLHVELTSSEISKITNFESERWYKIESTKEDLKGKIVESNFFVNIQDTARNIVFGLYNNSGGVIFVVYILILILPLLFLRRIENLTRGEIGLTIGMYLLGGLLLSAVVMFTKKKKNLAFTFLGTWILLLIILVL